MAELIFRDGKREVPTHLELQMRKMNVRTMTYQQALDAVNKLQMSDFLNREQRRIVSDHFRRIGS